jgi:hypothetical protein
MKPIFSLALECPAPVEFLSESPRAKASWVFLPGSWQQPAIIGAHAWAFERVSFRDNSASYRARAWYAKRPYEALKEILWNEEYDITDEHRDLSAISTWGGVTRLRRVFTTNFDQLLEKTFGTLFA